MVVNESEALMGQRSRSHETEVGYKNPFQQDSAELSRNFNQNMAGMCYSNWDAEGQRSKLPEAEDRFGGLAEGRHHSRVE